MSDRLLAIVVILLAVNAVLPAKVASMISRPAGLVSDTLLWPVTAAIHGAVTSEVELPDVGTVPDQHPAQALHIIERLQDEVDRLRAEVSTLRQVREVIGEDTPLQLVSAQVVGLDADELRPKLRLAEGSNTGIEKGQVVVSGPYLVGRVESTGPLTSRVSLIDGVGLQFQVKFSSPDLSAVVREESRHIEARRDGRFYTLDGVGRDTAIQVGDLARLVDPRWPAESQAFFVGKVVQVRPIANDILRSEVVIEPLLPLSQLDSVEVLIPKD